MVAPGTPVLVPGTPIDSAFPLDRYRFPELQGVVRAFIRSTTEPGELVLAIGAISGAAIGEIIAEQRRVVALGRNPLDLVRAGLDLTSVASHRAQIALTQLGDQPKAGHPLILHIKELYQSRCPHCQHPGTAVWFAWDREQGRPFAKQVACRHCDQVHEGPVDAEDVTKAGEYPVTSGPAYHLALSNALGPDHSDADRVTQLIQLYTPRNLATLMDLIQRVPRLHLDHDLRLVMDALLLEAFDAGSALVPYETPSARPRSLRVPQRFLERNVWMILDEAAAAYRERHGADEEPSPPVFHRPHEVSDLAAFLVHPERSYALLNRSIQSLSGHDLEGRFRALIVHLVPPDATYWALAVLWSLWLWGDSVDNDLRGFMHRRRLDWDWYQRSLAVALNYAQPYLAPEAPILLLTPTADLPAPKAIVHAVSYSGLTVDRWLMCPPDGYRVQARVPQLRQPKSDENGKDTARAPTAVAAEILRQRGEPMRDRDLRAAVILSSGQETVQALETTASISPLTVVGEDMIWLRAPSEIDLPLADRVEALVVRLLTSESSWRSGDLLEKIYETYHGALSPEPELVWAIIEAYTSSDAEGELALRPEDEPQRRRKEEQQLRRDLIALGGRLSYSPVRRLNGDLVWREDGAHPYLFRMTTSALLAPHLLKPPPRCDGRRCLVLPGGRAALTALKLRRDPRLARFAEEQKWTFIKYRHLRRMIEEISYRAEIEVFLGLDPIVEKPGAQIPLPLDMTSRQ